jgi:type VI secretion system (T6SS) baseplate-like injector VgrG
MRNAGRKFLGTYRGTVVSNEDLLKRGRLKILVADVLGPIPAFWAEPSTPLAGVGAGMYVRPQPGAKVWVEFEQGDPDKPVWTGFWRGSQADMPAEALAAPPGVPVIVLATGPTNAISISEAPGPPPGGIVIRHGAAFIAINDAGIQISNGQGATITLTGTAVDINQGAITALK